MTKIKETFDPTIETVVQDGFMVTVSNRLINLWNPESKENEFVIEDIAHGLANNCRWNGHTKHKFSIAQHCCEMYDNAPEGKKLMFLLHDAEEAYWSDIISPVKAMLRKENSAIPQLAIRLRTEIYRALGVPYVFNEYKDLDKILCYIEYTIRLREKPLPKQYKQYDIDPYYWDEDRAKSEFLTRFYKG